jgi:hypothetical protein
VQPVGYETTAAGDDQDYHDGGDELAEQAESLRV